MPADIYRFADFELDRSAYQLRRKGRPVRIERIPLDLLFLLAERPGQLVTREDMIKRIWGKDVFFDTDNSINAAVRKIRQVLHDGAETPHFVATVPTKGYRFIASLREMPDVASHRAAENRVHPRPSAMVGRARELSELRAGLADATAGRGSLLLISGEPGIGKTRLSAELASLAQAGAMEVRIGQCLDREESVTYLPFVEILETCVDRTSNPRELRKLVGDEGPELARLMPRLGRLLPDLAPPIDLPLRETRRHLFNSFCDFTARLVSEQPTLFIVEDLHWADDSTLSLLDHLVKRISKLPLLIVGTFREAEVDLSPGLAQTLEDLLRGHLASRIRLKTLLLDDVAEMLTRLSGMSPPAKVVREIYDETGGNPFFVEELFRHLEDENRLYDSSGQFRSTLEIAELEAPPSVRLIVGRRLARLSDLTQKMLATAAVIGRFFSFEILQASNEADADSVLESVEQAEKAGLVFSVVGSPTVRFEFSHELIRQAVIAGLSAARRQRLHLEVAEAIERSCAAASESTYAGSLDDHVAEMAHHYARGGNPAKAAEYCLRAVRQFSHIGSNPEAVAQFETGLEQLQKLPDDDRRAELELDLRNAAGSALTTIKSYASIEMEQSSARAMMLCQRPGINWEKAWSALFWVLWVNQARPEMRKASEIAAELIARAAEHGSTGHIADATFWSASVRMMSGDFELAAQGFDRSWALWESIAQQATGRPHQCTGLTPQAGIQPWMQALNRIFSAGNLWFLGHPDRSLERVSIATAVAHESGSKLALEGVHFYASYIYELRRELEQMRDRAEAALVLSTELGNVTRRAVSEVFLGWVDAMMGDLDGGIARMRHNMKAAGSEHFDDLFPALITTALGRIGRFDEGLRVIDEVFPFIERTGQRLYEAEVHRLKGELLLAQNASNAVRAEQAFRTAIEISRKQRAKSWELRATTSLARLLAKQAKRKKAQAMLAEIYGWFTEGFDTADLKDAKALLEELNA
jgi:DNA-binding winged helix-turn-helix (wHTH) protein/tetratricopeptide (TPR) repeat protein